MHYAATAFVKILERKPGLELAGFAIVVWVGVRLTVYTLSHPAVAMIPAGFPKTPEWKVTFYVVLVLIALAGWFLSKETCEEQPQNS